MLPLAEIRVETQHGYGRHQWDVPMSVLTPSDFDVRGSYLSLAVHWRLKQEIPRSYTRCFSYATFPFSVLSFQYFYSTSAYSP